MAMKVLNAEQKSPLALTATTADKVEIMNNKITPSTGLLYMSWVRTPCENEIPVGTSLQTRTVVNKVNRQGKWQFGMTRLKFKFTGTIPALSTGASIGYIGLRIANQVLATYSGELFNQRHESLMANVNIIDVARKYGMLERALLLDTVNEQPLNGNIVTGTEYITYVPSLIPSFTGIRANWDVEILEPLIIRTTYTDAAKIGLPTDVGIVGSATAGDSCDLFTQSIDYDPEYKDKLYRANFGDSGQDMPYFSYDSEVYVMPLTKNGNDNNSARVKLPFTNPSYLLHVFVRPVGLGVGATIATPPFLAAKVIDVNLGNLPYISDIPTKISSYKADSSGAGSMSLVRGAANACLWEAPTNKVHTFCWCDRPQDRRGFSGCIAFGGINNPELILKFGEAPTFANWEVVVVDNYYCELLMNGVSGKVYKSIAS